VLRIIEAYSTERVLTTERVRGVKVDEVSRSPVSIRRLAGHARRRPGGRGHEAPGRRECLIVDIAVGEI